MGLEALALFLFGGDVMKNQREVLKKAGAVYTPGHGWAIPDPNTGTCWWDESSYNGTIFLGPNAKYAVECLRELDNDDAD